MNISFADMNLENESLNLSCELFKGFRLRSSSAAALIGFVVWVQHAVYLLQVYTFSYSVTVN